MGGVGGGEDQIGLRKYRALKSWNFVRYPPSMDALSQREREGPKRSLGG
jgi:hypothetical protein